MEIQEGDIFKYLDTSGRLHVLEVQYVSLPDGQVEYSFDGDGDHSLSAVRFMQIIHEIGAIEIDWNPFVGISIDLARRLNLQERT